METKSYTKKELRPLMEVTGYPMASIEKTMRLLELLQAINADVYLGTNLALKGGTAINIIHYSEIPRLSVDLDFDLARNTLKEEMLQVKDEVSARIRKLAATMGYFLSDPRPNYAIHQTELYYQSATGNQDKIKLDINCLSRCHIFEPVVREVRNPFISDEIFPVRASSTKRAIFVHETTEIHLSRTRRPVFVDEIRWSHMVWAIGISNFFRILAEPTLTL